MARLQRAIVLATLIFGGLMSMPCRADQTVEVAAALPAVGTTDPVMNRAIDYLKASEEAQKRKNRRENMKPATQEKVVRAHQSERDNTLILGIDNTAALPM